MCRYIHSVPKTPNTFFDLLSLQYYHDAGQTHLYKPSKSRSISNPHSNNHLLQQYSPIFKKKYSFDKHKSVI